MGGHGWALGLGGGRAAWARAQFKDAPAATCRAEPGAAWSPSQRGCRGQGAGSHWSLPSAGRPLSRSFPRGLGCEEHQPARDPSQHQHRRHQHQSAQPVTVHVSVLWQGGLPTHAGRGLGWLGERSWAVVGSPCPFWVSARVAHGEPGVLPGGLGWLVEGGEQ